MSDFFLSTTPRRAAFRRTFLAATFLALTIWLLGGGPAQARSFGPPWEGQVNVSHTVVYTQPDPSSAAVGPLGRGAIVVVLAQTTGADGNQWLKIPDGYVADNDVDEMLYPWTAEVTVPSVQVYARPYPDSGIMRTAVKGDLLRVTGVSGGLAGDSNVWWATTAGYLPLGTLKWSTNDWAGWWQLPDASEAPDGWWATIRSQTNVRAAPTTDSPIVGTFAGGEHVKVLAEEQGQSIGGSNVWYLIDGGRYAGARVHSSVVARQAAPKANTTPPPPDWGATSWIVVDRKASTLTFVENGQPLFVTYVSLGQAGVATPAGSYSTFGKFLGDRMSSRTVANPTHPYDLPNVPFTQYYKDGGYGIHGTYWHDYFGQAESQGCINLTWTDSAYLFGLTQPQMGPGGVQAWASSQGGAATPVVILD